MSQKRILMTGGRGPATLELARQFHRLGHEVFVAEAQRIHFCTFSNAVKKAFVIPSPLTDEEGFVQAIIELLKTNCIDYLIPTYDEVYFIAKYKGVFSQYTEVFCDRIAMIDQLNNKQKFMAWMDELGFNVPQTRMVRDKAEYLALIQQNAVPYPHILKPAYTGGGVDVLKISNTDQALNTTAFFPSLVQEFIEGDGFCTFGIAHKGKLSCHAAYRPLYIFRENGAAICFQAVANPAILAFVSAIVEAAHFTGMLGFDLIRKKDGTLWAIECNPRITNGVHLIEKTDHIDEHFFGLQPLRVIFPEKPRQISQATMLRVIGKPETKHYRQWLYCFFNAKEAIFDWRDPLPALSMPLIGMHFLMQYIRYKKTPEEAIFYNAEWDIDNEDIGTRAAALSHKSFHGVSSLFCKPLPRRA
jgi:hypothetical protein